MELKCEASLLLEMAEARQHIFCFLRCFLYPDSFSVAVPAVFRNGENEPFGWFNAKNDKAFPRSIGLG